MQGGAFSEGSQVTNGMRRQGSRKSTKTLARAAYMQRKLDVVWPVGPQQWTTITGYLVGMDDYYLELVEVPHFPDLHLFTVPPAVCIVHKAAPLIRIHGNKTLKDEEAVIREQVTKVGGTFWEHCRQMYSGKNNSEESS